MKIVEISEPFNANTTREIKLKSVDSEFYWRIDYNGEDPYGPEYHVGDEYVLRLSKLV